MNKTNKIIEKLKESINKFEKDEVSLYNFSLEIGRCSNNLRSEVMDAMDKEHGDGRAN